MTNLQTKDVISSMVLSLDQYKNDVKEINVSDPITAHSAKNILSLINRDVKMIEEKRKFIVKPYNDIVKQINTLAKWRQAEYEPIKEEIKTKMLVYQEDIDKKKAEEEKILREAAAESEWWEEIEEIVEAETKSINYEYKYNSAKGTYIDYEIESVDIDKIPNEYLEVKEWKIRTDLRKWINIPWVIYKEVKKIK